MATSLLKKISGTITINGMLPGAASFPLGITIELSTVATSGPAGWIGSAVVNGTGIFELFTSYDLGLTENLSYSLLKNGRILLQGTVTVNDLVLELALATSDYQAIWADELEGSVTISGRVTLGEKQVLASPVIPADTKVVAYSPAFRDNIVIGETLLSEDGDYCFKIPLRALQPGTALPSACCDDRNPLKLFLKLVAGAEELGSTALLQVEDAYVQADFRIDNPAHFSFFYTELDYASRKVTAVTDLPPEQFYTITTEGDHSELSMIMAATTAPPGLIANLVIAAHCAQDMDMVLPHAYVFVRAGYTTVDAISGLDASRVAELVTDGIADHIIGSGSADVTRTLEEIDRVGNTAYISEETQDGDTLEAILLSVIDDKIVTDAFLRLARLESEEEDLDAFWLGVETEIGATNAQRLKRGLQVLALTGLQPEISAAVMALDTVADIPKSIAAMSAGEWNSLVTTTSQTAGKLCVPKVIRAEATDPNNPVIIARYADLLYELSSQLYASDVTNYRIAQDPTFATLFQRPLDIIAFLNANPTYDFRVSNIWERADITDEVKNDMLPLQNLVRLCDGDMDTVEHLLKDGIKSSSHIVGMEEATFVERYFDSNLEKSLIAGKKIYAQAKYTDLLSKNYYIQLLPNQYVDKVTQTVNKDIWYGAHQTPPSPQLTPDFAALFGSMDFCSCSDCTSMYSPAAYYTDLLNFIKTRLGDTAAYEELLRRRSDLVHIDLSCKNSHTPLPYIDLVIEQLELLVLRKMLADADPSVPFVPASFQTSGTANELLAYPEHVYKTVTFAYADYPAYDAVYDQKLNNAVFPNSLPFDLPIAESRVFFNHLGYTRYQLMQRFQPHDYLNTDGDDSLLSAYKMAAEFFGLPLKSADIVTNQAGNTLNLYYGIASSGAGWYNVLCNDLETLLERTNITYLELLQLLVTDFLNKASGAPPERPVAIVAKPGYPVDTCVVAQLMLAFSPDQEAVKLAFFDRLHRFVRLYKASKLSIYQLDIIVASLQATDITPAVLIALRQAIDMAGEIAAAPETATVIWSGISTRRYINFASDSQPELPSVYDTLFRNKAVINPVDPNFDDPGQILGTLGENMGTIIAAFGISETDVYQAINGAVDDNTTLANLSHIYRYALTMKALGFATYQEFYDTLLLTGVPVFSSDPFVLMNNWQQTLTAITALRKMVFSTDELSYLIGNTDETQTFLPAAADIQGFFEALRLNLKNLYKIPLTTDIEDALKKLVTEQWTAEFNAGSLVVNYLINDVIRYQPAGDPVLSYLASAAFIDTIDKITDLLYPGLHKAYIQLQKALLIVSGLKLSPKELTAFQEKNTSFKTPDFSRLPTPIPLNVSNDLLAFSSLSHLDDWIVWRDQMSLKEDAFIALLGVSTGALKEEWLELVPQLTQWDPATISYLAGDENSEGVLNVHFDIIPGNSDFVYAALLLQMKEVIIALDKIGLKAPDVYAALLPGIVMDSARKVRMAAKARYTIEAWWKAVKPLQDVLRKQQRDALLDYVLAHQDLVAGNNMLWKNENDLFAYLLIDVEMSSCMNTSRIRLAMSTLQLYLDRIILNIERENGGAGITMPDAMAAQWQSWRKWYRVWEANRKVFLYPENWIEPELRDDKTSLFKELESFLLQDEATDERLEEGFRIYLEGLDEIARLEPVTLYHETTAGKDILHAFGRTDTNPQRYFYRKRQDNRWTAWERLPIDIKSDHVTPVIWNSKLYLFWLTFQTKTASASPSTTPSVNGGAQLWVEAAVPYYNQASNPALDAEGLQLDITLNWSLCQHDKWLNHEQCKDIMNLDISKLLIDSVSADSYNGSGATAAFDLLTRKRKDKIEDFFKNRIYLLSPMEQQQEGGGVCFNILFPLGMNEIGNGVHAFLWKGDNSKDPYVLQDSDRGHMLAAPYGTRFHKMKFEQDTGLGKALNKDNNYLKGNVGYYTYTWPAYFNNQVRFTGRQSSSAVLKDTPFGRYRLTGKATSSTKPDTNPITDRFFFEDNNHTFYVEKAPRPVIRSTVIDRVLKTPTIGSVLANVNQWYGQWTASSGITGILPQTIYGSLVASNFPDDGYRFYTFYHAQIGQLIASLNNTGIDGLLTLSNQSQPDTMNFTGNYQPTALVQAPYANNKMQFGFSDPYGMYNWEIFFHIPMIIAQGLSRNQQFEAAQKWYHYVFNPTSNTGVATIQRFWKFQPFYAASGQPAQTLSELLIAINQNNAEYVQQVRVWEQHPFNPHIIARMRILAYMKNVLMKYLDNLIAWGDSLFRRDTIESINEATQLYILAANLLGERPREIPPRVKRADYTFLQLLEDGPLDALSNAMVQIESFYAPNDAPAGSDLYETGGNGRPSKDPPEGLRLETLYFCLPKNDKLLAYWDTIADRLFKIRHCQTIDGQTRQLALYEPPIDPALLVRAAAMGISIGDILDGVSGQTLPKYRFQVLLQKANEVVNDVKALGGAILAAMEKKDAETLAILRSTHELQLLDRIKVVKEMQLSEAETALEALQKTKEATQLRYQYYASRTFMNANEAAHLDKLENVKTLQVVQGVLQTVAGLLSAMPTLHAQLAASGASFGGLQLSNIMQAASTAIGIKVGLENIRGTMAVTTGGYQRRMDDWRFQADNATKELEQLDKQLLGAEIRIAITQKELSNQELQMEQASETDAYMRSKFTNTELYSWMQGQLATSYFLSYQLAYELAKKAEKCYDYELPAALENKPATDFVKPGYWDSLRKGLLSGENLQFDLRKMESSYFDENLRHKELTKNISMAIWSPEQLLDLKANGTCTFDIPELLYDLDYPGHYMRRIKSVSISIPCVAGPYTTVNCELTQGSSKYRDKVAITNNYNDEANFIQVSGGTMVATSTGQNDSGVFELNFRDERYLPFEGTGAISSWTLDFPRNYRQFDYDTITDVIFHIRYTSLPGGGTEPPDGPGGAGTGLKGAAVVNLNNTFDSLIGDHSPLFRIFSLKHEFSNEWFAYQAALANEEPGAILKIRLLPEQFPFFCKGRKVTFEAWYLQLQPKTDQLQAVVEAANIGIVAPVTLIGNVGEEVPVTLPNLELGTGRNVDMTIAVTAPDQLSDIEDFYLVAGYILEDE